MNIRFPLKKSVLCPNNDANAPPFKRKNEPDRVVAHLMNPTNQESACRLENTIFKSTGSKTVADGKNVQ
jgi:hypothetical protein